MLWLLHIISRNTPSSAPDHIVRRSLNVSSLSTSYTFTRVTQLVLISYQLVVRNLTTEKKSQKNPYKAAPAEHPIKCVFLYIGFI